MEIKSNMIQKSVCYNLKERFELFVYGLCSILDGLIIVLSFTILDANFKASWLFRNN